MRVCGMRVLTFIAFTDPLIQHVQHLASDSHSIQQVYSTILVYLIKFLVHIGSAEHPFCVIIITLFHELQYGPELLLHTRTHSEAPLTVTQVLVNDWYQSV